MDNQKSPWPMMLIGLSLIILGLVLGAHVVGVWDA